MDKPQVPVYFCNERGTLGTIMLITSFYATGKKIKVSKQ